jgi:hypothetical protein
MVKINGLPVYPHDKTMRTVQETLQFCKMAMENHTFIEDSSTLFPRKNNPNLNWAYVRHIS